MVNAYDGREVSRADLLKYSYRKIGSTDDLSRGGAQVIDLKIKAPFLVRQMMNYLAKPIQADEIVKEEVRILELNLFFFPVYYFELRQRGKKVVSAVAINGVTGEINYKADRLSETLSKSFSAEDLFEVGKEIAELVIPGGALVVMAGQKAAEMFNSGK